MAGCKTKKMAKGGMVTAPKTAKAPAKQPMAANGMPVPKGYAKGGMVKGKKE